MKEKKKIITFMYVNWEGEGKLELEFSIGLGVNFGYAGESGLSYTIAKDQANGEIEFKEYKSEIYNWIHIKKLIFKKPGWYKIYLDKGENISGGR